MFESVVGYDNCVTIDSSNDGLVGPTTTMPLYELPEFRLLSGG